MCVFAVPVFLGIFLFAQPHRCSECPLGCECFAVTRTVKCVSKDLTTVPQTIPGYTRTAIITGNNIYQIEPDSFVEMENVTNIILSNNGITELASRSFSAFANLHFLDLSGNRLALVHPEALRIPGGPLQELNLSRSLHNFSALSDLTTALRWGSLGGLLRLDLSGNLLTLLPPVMFSHLPSLQQLFLHNNSLQTIYGGTFSGINHLEVLDLRYNAFRVFNEDSLREFDKLGDIWIFLGNNPYACSCNIRRFVAWLNESKAWLDADSVRCASPKGLRGNRVRGLGVQDIGCVVQVQAEEVLPDLTLQTSYVFLGLVLGFVGMVFLFVLYLNRKDMKKWFLDMRDACHDVLEGYHYRYEIDSDTRLGRVQADNGVGAGSGRRTQGHLGLALSQQPPADTYIVQPNANTQLKQVTTSPPTNL